MLPSVGRHWKTSAHWIFNKKKRIKYNLLRLRKIIRSRSRFLQYMRTGRRTLSALGIQQYSDRENSVDSLNVKRTVILVNRG